MSGEWKHQVRIYLEEAQAEAVRREPRDALPQPLAEILARHRATLSNQLQAFEDYVAEAEKVGVESFPLYRWTKVTIEDPEKRELRQCGHANCTERTEFILKRFLLNIRTSISHA